MSGFRMARDDEEGSDVGQGSDGSHESIHLRPTSFRSGKLEKRPRLPEAMQEHSRSSFLRRWRRESSTTSLQNLQKASPPETPGTPISLMAPNPSWIPGDNGSLNSRSDSPIRSQSPAFGYPPSSYPSGGYLSGGYPSGFNGTPLVCS